MPLSRPMTAARRTITPSTPSKRVAPVVRKQEDSIVSLNPRVIDEATEKDEQYEECLSFLDVRGMVHRSVAIEVEHPRSRWPYADHRIRTGPAD